MSNDIEYFDQVLWQSADKQISNSILLYDKFCVIDKWGTSTLKLKMSIKQFRSSSGNNDIYLTHQDVFIILQKLKKELANINKIVSDVNSNNQTQINVQIKLKKNIIFTFLNRVEYGGCCVRVILSNNSSDHYLDSEKVYLSLFDFLSLLKILGEFRDSYIAASDRAQNSILLNMAIQELRNLNHKVANYYSESVQMFRDRSLLMSQQAKMNQTFTASSEPFSPEELPDKSQESNIHESESDQVDENLDPFGTIDQPSDEVNIPEIVSNEVETPEIVSNINHDDLNASSENIDLQNDMDSFIKTEIPKINLGLSEEEKTKADTSEAIVSTCEFTDVILKNDILNLEMYITNLVNDDLPFRKLCELIQSKLGFNPLENVSNDEINCVDYLISNYLKHSLKKCLEDQVEFPANVSPIVFNNVKLSPEAISLMYDLFIYFIYYTQVRNMLKEKDYNPIQNREFICFSFKTIASPLAITGFNGIDEQVLLSEISNRYTRYLKMGVFDKLKDEIKSKYSCEFNLQVDTIKHEASRIWNAVKTNYDKLTVEYSFKKFSNLNFKLGYFDFKENDLQKEQIKKLIALEFNFKKNGKVIYDEISYDNFDDIPISILNKFDIKEVKYDNTNLKRYVKEITKDDESIRNYALSICEKINYSYRDIRNVKFDLTILPLDILKAIFLWDIDRDEKITNNYIYYRDTIQNCSLTKDMIISMLTNIQDVIDVDFINSFITVRK